MNPNSLQNLVPGARKGMKRNINQKIADGITRFLDSRFADMMDAFDNLDDKDKVLYWSKLADRFLPKPEPEKKEDEVGSKLVTLVTQLVGHEKPQPLLDIMQLEENGLLSVLSAEVTPASPEATDKNEENEAGVIDI